MRKRLGSKRLLPLLAAVSLLTAAALGRPAAATTYVSMSDEELLDRSPTVVEGVIAALAAAPGRKLPAIDYMVDVDRLIKGFIPGSSLIVRVPGGVRPDRVGLKIWGAPRFAEGEEVVLFLVPRRDGTFALHQLMLGAFHVERLGPRKIARRHLDEAREVAAPGAGSAADSARDLGAFRDWLADRVAGRERPSDYFLPGVELAPKFALVASTAAPPPQGCGVTGGHHARWFEFDALQPVTWRTHVDGQAGLANGGAAELAAALDAWGDDPHTPVRLVHAGSTAATGGLAAPDDRNTVLFEDPNDEIGGSFAGSGILAMGGPWFSCDLEPYAGELFHSIFEADVVTQDGVHAFFESLAEASSSARELFAHELGHTLGLGHSRHREALMRAVIHNDGRAAAFDVDDLGAAFHLYGRPDLPAGAAAEAPPLSRPAAPSELAATALAATLVELTWRDNADDESNVRIERRRRGDLNFRLVTTVAAGRTSFVDGVEPKTTYTYRVQSQNAAGRSRHSQLVAVVTPEDRRPAAPSSLWTAALADDRVRLTWQDNADDETSFLIALSWAQGSAEIVLDEPDSSAADLTGLPPGVRFAFRVRARNAFGVSAPSNESVSVTFPAGATCVSEARRLCLEGGRFAVEVDYRDPSDDSRRRGRAMPATDRSGFFWFFEPGSIELLVRVLETPDGGLRIVHAGLSNVEYRIAVTDTATGEVHEYHNPVGRFCAPEPPPAFSFPPEAAGARPSRDLRTLLARSKPATIDPEALTLVAGGLAWRKSGDAFTPPPCRRDEERLCLLDGRFAAVISWIDPMTPGSPKMAAAAGLGSTGLFSFGDASQPEVVLKLLDGRALNDHFWVFASAALPLVDFRITVTDTATGTRRTYHQPVGAICGVADTGAFAD